MADSNKNALFDSIFSDIHEELEDLNNKISVLQEIYLTDYNSDKKSDHETNKLSISKTYNETSSVSLDVYVYVDNFFTTDQQAALKRYQEMKAMSQNELNLCFLGIIDASMHATEFKNRIQKKYLTTKYKFEGISICQSAWYLIYDIQKRRWENLRAHYQTSGLAPKIHGLTGC
ncbi:16756_t:CDS:2, partial [Gigaspora margarita]